MMTVKDLIDRLQKFEPDMPLIFYNLDNYDLEQRYVETILEADGRVELTVQSTEEEEDENAIYYYR
jgi:hypothetical protein